MSGGYSDGYNEDLPVRQSMAPDIFGGGGRGMSLDHEDPTEYYFRAYCRRQEELAGYRRRIADFTAAGDARNMAIAADWVKHAEAVLSGMAKPLGWKS